jgi:uncharacterized membrane protein
MNEFLANAHPFIVHFAVALSMLTGLFELLSYAFLKDHLRATALSLAITAVPFLLLAVLTGNLAEAYLPDPLRSPNLETHKMLANITVWTFTAVVFWYVYMRTKKTISHWLRYLYLILILAIAVVSFFAAQYGGNIRHDHDQQMESSK